MSSRVTRTLLKLYPRRVRNRYGEELLDLEDELRAQGEVSRTRLIRDMLTGALLVRATHRRAHIVTGAVLVVVGLVVVGTVIDAHGSDSPARASHPQGRLTVRSAVAAPPICFVAAGSSCSLTPCNEFIGRPSVEDAVARGNVPTIQRPRRPTGTRCPAHPHAGPQSAVVTAQPAMSSAG